MLTRIVRLAAGVALLAALAVFAPAASLAGGGCHGDTTSDHSDKATTVVGMDSCAFQPTVARVPVGSEVRFLNLSQVTHVVAGEPAEWGQGRQLLASQDFRRRFDRPGIYPYSCPLHPGMVGAIVVGDAATADAALPVSTPTPAADVPAAPVAATQGQGMDAGALLIAGLAVLVAGLGAAIASLRGRPVPATPNASSIEDRRTRR